MAERSTSRIILDFITQLVDVFFKSSRTKKRTWHQHVVPYEDGWAVRREGNKKITSKHRKQETAIRKAKTLFFLVVAKERMVKSVSLLNSIPTPRTNEKIHLYISQLLFYTITFFNENNTSPKHSKKNQSPCGRTFN